MSTTQLFAELLIIGSGVIIWGALLVAGITGWKFDQLIFEKVLSSLWPMLIVIAYVLGILLDRIAYSVFDHRKNKIKDSIIDKSACCPPANSIEKIVSDSSIHLKSMIDYNRSRGRICRSWYINFLLIAATFLAWQIRTRQVSILSLQATPCILFTLAIISCMVGDELEKDHYNNIKHSYDYICNYKNIKKQGECGCPAATQQNKPISRRTKR
ncbi:hypothetical protein VU08_06735 [Desulfobulbus sp. F5]|nr:hypothetical protein [Desulfobulbus sp. F5]